MPETFATILTTIWEQVGKCMTTITGNAILMLPIAVSLVSAIIRIAKRFLRMGR